MIGDGRHESAPSGSITATVIAAAAEKPGSARIPKFERSNLSPAQVDLQTYGHDRAIAQPGDRILVRQVEQFVHAKYKCQCFPQFKNVSALGVGRRAGAEPRRSAAPDRRPQRGRAQPFPVFYRGIDYDLAGFDHLKNVAIQQLGYGTNSKLILQFAERLWDTEGAWGIGDGNIYMDEQPVTAVGRKQKPGSVANFLQTM